MSWPLAQGGLYLDREFAVVSNRTGKVLTQKTHPKLALCKIDIDLQTSRLTISNSQSDDADSNNISIHIHEQPSIKIEATNVSPSIIDDDVFVCSRSLPICRLDDMGTSIQQEYSLASAWLTTYLKEPCTLVRRKHNYPSVASKTISPGNFSNEAQFLLITERSLRLFSEVNEKLF